MVSAHRSCLRSSVIPTESSRKQTPLSLFVFRKKLHLFFYAATPPTWLWHCPVEILYSPPSRIVAMAIRLESTSRLSRLRRLTKVLLYGKPSRARLALASWAASPALDESQRCQSRTGRQAPAPLIPPLLEAREREAGREQGGGGSVTSLQSEHGGWSLPSTPDSTLSIRSWTLLSLRMLSPYTDPTF